MTTCVVCDAGIEPGGEMFSNSWEAARKRFPCCSKACADNFDPTVHWIPAQIPEPAAPDEEARLLGVVRRRLKNGDSPTVLTREMLQAGVDASALRKQLNDALVIGARAKRDARALSFFGALSGALTGAFFAGRSREKREPASIEDALCDVDKWQAHFTLG